MNLKEAFRYQNFLDSMMQNASYSIQMKDHCLAVTRNHKCNKANPDDADFEEVMNSEEEFFKNDDVISFMVFLVDEKKKLTEAIGKAKASLDFDIDAATAVNKYRQSLNSAIRSMMRFKPNKRLEIGIGHKFNVEGNQVEYKYDVEITSVEAYDKDKSKEVMRKVISEADEASTAIDAAKINTTVDYTPVFDVNDTFDDVMTAFLNMSSEEE